MNDQTTTFGAEMKILQAELDATTSPMHHCLQMINVHSTVWNVLN